MTVSDEYRPSSVHNMNSPTTLKRKTDHLAVAFADLVESMKALLQFIQQAAIGAIKLMDRYAITFTSLEKPPCLEVSIQTMMMEFDQETYETCHRIAMDIADWEIAKVFFDANDNLTSLMRTAAAASETRVPNRNKVKAASDFLAGASALQQEMEFRTKFNGLEEQIRSKLSKDPKELRKQLWRLAFVPREQLSTETVAFYIRMAHTSSSQEIWGEHLKELVQLLDRANELWRANEDEYATLLAEEVVDK